MIFIDTGPFLARYLAQDRRHEEAVACWRDLARERERCFTSNFVLNETFTLLARRAGYAFAAERALNILSSRALTVLRTGKEEELAAVALLSKFADQSVSFTDCASFVLMRRGRIRRAFTFDRHFAAAGFSLWPA